MCFNFKYSKQVNMVHQITFSKKQWVFVSEAVGFLHRRYTASGLKGHSFGFESALLRARTCSSSGPNVLFFGTEDMDVSSKTYGQLSTIVRMIKPFHPYNFTPTILLTTILLVYNLCVYRRE